MAGFGGLHLFKYSFSVEHLTEMKTKQVCLACRRFRPRLVLFVETADPCRILGILRKVFELFKTTISKVKTVENQA